MRQRGRPPSSRAGRAGCVGGTAEGVGAMAFSDFDLKAAREKFGLDTEEGRDLFATTPALEVPGHLRQLLDEWAPVALAMNTEKARSEMIIAPVLMAAVQLAPPP